LPKSSGPSKNYHLMLAMGEQDAITPLASGANQGPDIPSRNVFREAWLAQVAQLVEQRIENPRVTGSIPVLGTIYIIRYQAQLPLPE
jgi:hypothetical protein